MTVACVLAKPHLTKTVERNTLKRGKSHEVRSNRNDLYVSVEEE
jgi:hypothetical protein